MCNLEVVQLLYGDNILYNLIFNSFCTDVYLHLCIYVDKNAPIDVTSPNFNAAINSIYKTETWNHNKSNMT